MSQCQILKMPVLLIEVLGLTKELKGECSLLSHGHCQFLGGRFHYGEREHCSQSHCDSFTCDVSRPEQDGHSDEEETIDDEEVGKHGDIVREHSHRQYWRLPVSLFLHRGMVHFIMVAVTQVLLGVEAEKISGWLRIAIIYLVSGFGGLLVGSALRPLEPVVGGGGAAMGLIGVHIVDLIQSWTLVERPRKSLLKLLALTTLFTLAGTLPQVNQFVQWTGFIAGMLTAIICLPYIRYNFWSSKGRIVMKVISGVVIFILTILSFFMFYTAQPSDIGALKYFDCVPLIKYTCDEQLP